MTEAAEPGSRALARGEWKAGAGLLMASMIAFTCSSAPLAVVGALVRPLGAEFGWSRASIALAILITAFGTLGMAPFVGPLVDRVGPRKVGLCGLLMVACGTASIGLAGPTIYSWYAGWAFYAVTQAFSNNVIWSNAVISRFDRNRGTALAVLLTVQALSFGLLPTIALHIMGTLGWPWIFFSIALATLLLGWPLAWKFLYAARDLAPRPAAHSSDDGKVVRSPHGALKTVTFWQIAISFCIAAAAVSALLVHLQPILTDGGISPKSAALAVLIIGPASVAGRLFSGILLDHFPPRLIAAVAIILPAMAYGALLLFGGTVGTAFAAALFIGLAAGAESDLLAYMVSRYFRQRAYSSVYSILLGMYGIGYGIAPVAAGAVYDATNSYQPIFIALLVAALAGAGLILALGKPRPASELEEVRSNADQ